VDAHRPALTARNFRLANTVAATAFAIGGTLFAVGAALAQSGVEFTVCATIYLVGGIFFSAGGYTSVVQVVNEPPGGLEGELPGRWRWWSREPGRLQWLATPSPPGSPTGAPSLAPTASPWRASCRSASTRSDHAAAGSRCG
jgi:hypothetical protein